MKDKCKTISEITYGEDTVEVIVHYHIENDGIGWYEYWGAKCYDAGQDYPEIDDIVPVFHLESESEKANINNYIDANFESLARELEAKMVQEREEFD